MSLKLLSFLSKMHFQKMLNTMGWWEVKVGAEFVYTSALISIVPAGMEYVKVISEGPVALCWLVWTEWMG